MLNFWPSCQIFSMAITLTQMFHLKQTDLRYILQWSGPSNDPNLFLGTGLQMFVEANCSFANCYVTSDKRYFYGTDDFDAIIFDVKDLRQLDTLDFPPKRCWRQKFILTATEAAESQPICTKYSLNSYFNWTWTYKLNSDLPRPYLTVFEAEGEPIGPSLYMTWIDKQLPITPSVIELVQNKNKAAAWFVNECQTRSKREDLVKRISHELEQYDLSVDIYGQCGTRPCSEEDPQCLDMLKKHYFFYLAFESSLSPDFVTGSVVTAFDNYVVPIVYGEADYTRFLPPGSYLDAKLLGPERIAREIVDTISNQSLFYDFFRWRNHYEILRNDLSTDICGLCAIMNEPELLLEATTYDNIEQWFNVDSSRCTHDQQIDSLESSEEYEDTAEAKSEAKPEAKPETTPEAKPETTPEAKFEDNLEESPNYNMNLTMSEDVSNSSEPDDR